MAPMTARYRNQINECMAEIANLALEKQSLDRRIGKLQQIVRANADMLSDAERESVLLALDDAVLPTGFTQAIRFELRRAGQRGLTPKEMRAALIHRSVDLHSQSNPLASIHTVLKRLLAAGEADLQTRAAPKGKEESVYCWRPTADTIADSIPSDDTSASP
jgi:hypothetical protein